MDKKDIYVEIGTNYRYFLDWRHKLLAGYLVTVAGLAVGFSWAFTNNELSPLSCIILFLGFLISLIFWGLDYRNRDLYHICQKAGCQIENEEKIENSHGMYTALEKSKSRFTHSLVLDSMFIISALGFLIGAIFALCYTICK